MAAPTNARAMPVFPLVELDQLLARLKDAAAFRRPKPCSEPMRSLTE